jgi:membrane-bound lytic murein transglycosylase MltF
MNMKRIALALIALAATQLPLMAHAQEGAKVMALPGVRTWTGDFDDMITRRQVRILVPFSKTLFFIDRGTARGIEAEFGQQFEQWLNKRYGQKVYKIHVVFVPTTHDRLFSELIAGKGDIAAGTLTVTPERKALVDFAEPWASGVKEVLVTGPASPEVTSLDDLAGKAIAARKSSSYYTHLTALNDERKKAKLPLLQIEPADENLEDEDLLEMVSAGLLPWAVVDRFMAQAWAGILKGLTIREDIAINEGGEIAWAIRKNSPKLAKELAEFVAIHKVGTAFGNDLRLRYTKNPKVLKNALAKTEAEKLKTLLAHFREYGTRFDIDPYLLAAQGYQESVLNQQLRNKSGAVGVMQIKPSTAAEKQVAIANVAGSAENNIHAGAKYLRFLADKYIPDPDVEPRERVLFALAAYNAGPGNLKKFRAFAEQHGLKPTVWFGNVENGAAAIVGYETVQYIGNIYKYYIAYVAADQKAILQKATEPKVER